MSFNKQFVVNIKVSDTECVLLGTAHISKQSVVQVKAEISSGDYDAVAVELCESRYKKMCNPDQFATTDLWQIIRQGKTGMMMANLALAPFLGPPSSRGLPSVIRSKR